jgi:serine/threonine protein phosphatase PrpC
MVAAVLLPTMLISVNVGDSRLTVLRAADLSTLFATMDQDMTVKARVDHIVAAQGSLLRKGGPQSNHRLVSFLPKAGEKTDAAGLHYSHKVWSEARVALPEEWKEVDLLPNRFFKVTKTLNLAGTMGDISFKLSRATFVRLKQLIAEIEQTANASVAMPVAQAHQFLLQQLHPSRLRVDLETRTIVDSTPDVAFYPIVPSDERMLMVLASDGLWQYLRTEDDAELCAILRNFYPLVLGEMGADVRALATKHNINLAAADDEQRAALVAELEENPKSVRRLMLALHRMVNELNTYVLMPQRSSNLVRDDFSAVVMDVQILRGLQLVPNTPNKDAAGAGAAAAAAPAVPPTIAAATPAALSVAQPLASSACVPVATAPTSANAIAAHAAAAAAAQ